MPWLLAVLKAIAAFPAILSALKELGGWLETQFGPNWPERIEDLRVASDVWTKAKNAKERNHAVAEMARAFNSSK